MKHRRFSVTAGVALATSILATPVMAEMTAAERAFLGNLTGAGAGTGPTQGAAFGNSPEVQAAPVAVAPAAPSYTPRAPAVRQAMPVAPAPLPATYEPVAPAPAVTVAARPAVAPVPAPSPLPAVSFEAAAPAPAPVTTVAYEPVAEPASPIATYEPVETVAAEPAEAPVALTATYEPVAPVPAPVETVALDPVAEPTSTPTTPAPVTYVQEAPATYVPAPIETVAAPTPAPVPAPVEAVVAPAPVVVARVPVARMPVARMPVAAPKPVQGTSRVVPEAVAYAPKSDRSLEASIRVTFASGSSALSRQAINELSVACNTLPTLPEGSLFQVIGHADSEGSAEYNLPLSERRAREVRRHLVEECSLSPDSIVAMGMGERYAKQGFADPADRRVEFRLVGASS